MDSEADNLTPIVPHNSVVDFRNAHSADDSNKYSKSKRDWKDERNVVGYQPLKRTIADGKAARESLKARLYDRPENSEVFRAMLRPLEVVSTTNSQVCIHENLKNNHTDKLLFFTLGTIVALPTTNTFIFTFLKVFWNFTT